MRMGWLCSQLMDAIRAQMQRLTQSPLGRRLAVGTAWSLGGAVGSRAATLIGSFIVARLLGRVGFGEYGMVVSTIGMLQTVVGFATGVTATRYVAQWRNRDNDYVGRIIAMTLVFATLAAAMGALALLLAAEWLAAETLAAPHLVVELRWASLLLFFATVNGAQTGALAGFESFRKLAVLSTAVAFVGVPLTVACAYLDGLRGTVIGMIATQALSVVLHHMTLHSTANEASVVICFRNCLREHNVLWRFSLPAALGGILVGPVNWGCNALLVNRPRGYEEMGVYQAANQWFLAMMFLPALIGQVALPLMSESLGKGEVMSTRRLFLQLLKLTSAIALPICCIVAIFSEQIMVIYGESFRGSGSVLVLTAATAVIVAFQTPIAAFIAAASRMWAGFFLNLAWATLFLVGATIAVRWGAFGLASARCVAYGGHALWTLLYASSLLRQRGQQETVA